ncbi:helix-turn-helix domain-containing protein [Altererythrobacter sp. H2]|uniref:helix-turn-helix domain-containing protein n=1 Tax=Altererythrobacter sp. H2 TaxID=3108391 RepID=UPI002B4BA548|nr:helix-turn-helix domain-containing protein [Altererythrobacter sp. H2]WRK95223.1 helix-turn-helix domain-containing protein [Altererythrobacter sp. H2]
MSADDSFGIGFLPGAWLTEMPDELREDAMAHKVDAAFASASGASRTLAENYDDWVDKLNRTFGKWQANQPSQQQFAADIRLQTLPGIALVDCRCDPCGANRSRRDTQDVDQEQLTIQLVLSGREYMRLGDQEAMLSSGDIFVWDNTQPMQFEVLEPLHKLSLVMPLQRLKDWIPTDWRELPRHLRGGEPGTELLADYVRSISRIDYSHSPMRYNALIEAAIAMLVAPIPARPSEGNHRLAQLELVKSRILRRLRDPELNLNDIAAECRISLRYLHWLFEADACTPWRYVVGQRLEGCRRDLVNPAFAHRSITDIAFSWGFSSVAHFGRKCRLEFGMTPSELRTQAISTH